MAYRTEYRFRIVHLRSITSERILDLRSITVAMNTEPTLPRAMVSPDVKLVVGQGSGKVEIPAFQQVLMGASPKFRALLLSQAFIEDDSVTGERKLVLSLPEDNAHAMTVLCNVIHLQSQKVISEVMTIDLLYKMATLVEKYGLFRAVLPWVESWLRKVNMDNDGSGLNALPVYSLAQLVCICYYFHHARYFAMCTTSLAKRAHHVDLREPGHGSATPLDQLPSDVRKRIFTRRQKYIDRCHGLCTSLVTDLKKGQSCVHGDPVIGIDCNDVFDCNSMLLGNAILAIKKEFGPGWRNNWAWEGTLMALRQKMEAVGHRLAGPARVMGDYDKDGRQTDHSACCKNASFIAQLPELFEKATKGLELATFKWDA